VIARVVEDNQDSPAHRAGMLPGDVVLRWAETDILEPAMLSQLVARTKIGEAVKVQVWREGQPLDVQVTVVERPRAFQ